MQQLQHYVLFPNHDNGMRLYKELKALGVRAVISPELPELPANAAEISLMVEEEDLDTIQSCAKDRGIEILKIAAVERDLNPKRDRYC